MELSELELLNKEQKNAVLYNEGPLRIIAGAGSGKTKVLTNKITYIIENLNVEPNKILALTFSNKAANEMSQRVFAHLKEDLSSKPTICTFHALCAKILRSEIHVMDYPHDFQIIDELDQKEVLKVVYGELGVSQSQFTFGSILSFIQNQKNLLKTPSDLEKDPDFKDDIRVKIFNNYQNHLDKAHTLDFEDLLVFVYRLFYEEKYEAILKKWQHRFSYIFVDEFQDTSRLQYNILRKLAQTKNITIVGDPDQTIYSWRNADINLIMNFDKDYPECKTIKLEQNYRSTKRILAAANSLISHNKLRLDKRLFSENEEGENIELYAGFSDEAEARWIADKINELKKNRVQLKNIAILYRINSYSRAIEEALINANTIYKLFGSIKFYQREEIKDALAYLRVIHDGSEISLLRIINKPSRKIGTATIEKLLEFAKSKNLDLFKCLEIHFQDIYNNLKLPTDTLKNIASLINSIRWARRALLTNDIHSTLKELMINKIQYFEEIKKSKEEYENRMENFNSLVDAIQSWEERNETGTIDEYLQEITLITDRDVEDDATSYVSLMTVHNAKGLEFDYVFIIGLAEKIFPLQRAILVSPKQDFTVLENRKINLGAKPVENIEALEEERRLAYVAITRAKKKLFVSFSVGRSDNRKSRFLIEAKIKEQKIIKTASDFSASMDINDNTKLIVGDKISHSRFGIGTIIDIQGDLITVKFNDTRSTKTLDKNHSAIRKWENNEN
ncbi:ATP-dependent helicase [Metamycoplasma orale]|uniref:DNA 3'-5' helicase n=1 Tax=Metamycoplasma orale TaxID=2121 RepID=A0A448ZX17_METOS|nr:UvrD-helicase domain-containing protein [Metamycoplasma orale]VEU55802.1 ATP-dependent DNA helicase UvrD/PcrA [Metamycoplasma orale]